MHKRKKIFFDAFSVKLFMYAILGAMYGLDCAIAFILCFVVAPEMISAANTITVISGFVLFGLVTITIVCLTIYLIKRLKNAN